MAFRSFDTPGSMGLRSVAFLKSLRLDDVSSTDGRRIPACIHRVRRGQGIPDFATHDQSTIANAICNRKAVIQRVLGRWEGPKQPVREFPRSSSTALAEGARFELAVAFRLRLISSQVPLTTQPPFPPLITKRLDLALVLPICPFYTAILYDFGDDANRSRSRASPTNLEVAENPVHELASLRTNGRVLRPDSNGRQAHLLKPHGDARTRPSKVIAPGAEGFWRMDNGVKPGQLTFAHQTPSRAGKDVLCPRWPLSVNERLNPVTCRMSMFDPTVLDPNARVSVADREDRVRLRAHHGVASEDGEREVQRLIWFWSAVAHYRDSHAGLRVSGEHVDWPTRLPIPEVHGQAVHIPEIGDIGGATIGLQQDDDPVRGRRCAGKGQMPSTGGLPPFEAGGFELDDAGGYGGQRREKGQEQSTPHGAPLRGDESRRHEWGAL